MPHPAHLAANRNRLSIDSLGVERTSVENPYQVHDSVSLNRLSRISFYFKFQHQVLPPISGVFRETHLGTWGRFEYISEQIDNDPSTDTQKHPKRITLDVNDMDYFQPLFQLVCCVVRPSTPKTHGAARPNIKTDDASGCASWKTWNASSFLFLGDS